MSEEKVWRSNDDAIKVVSLTDERLHDALQLERECFYTEEPVALAIKLQNCPEALNEVEQQTLDTYKDGASLVALKGDIVVGVAFNKIQKKTDHGEKGYFEDFMENRCKTDEAKEYMNLIIKMDCRIDIFKHYGVSKVLEVTYVVTSRTTRKQGVGTLLMAASEDVARSHGIPLCTAICSSPGTQKIRRALNWDLLVIANMSEFEFKGEPYSKFTGECQTLELVARRV